MNGDRAIHPAEERLLDAALVQLFAAQRRGATSGASRWLAAALLLLGVAVTATSMWLARRPADEAQDPVPLPREVEAIGKEGIAALPADTENLFAKLLDPRELPVITRLERLRCLRLWAEKLSIGPIKTQQHHATWNKPAVDLLRPLAKLPRLEVLKLPLQLAVTGDLLAPLAAHPSLREVQLAGEGVVIDDALVTALAAIPRLRALHFSFVTLDAESLRRLARLPLASLELEWCSGLDAAGWQAILAMRDLQRLAFKDWAWSTKAIEPGAPRPWRPGSEGVRLLQALPHLRSVALFSCGLRDEELAALPDTLHELDVRGHELSAAGFAHLHRFVVLRTLDIGVARNLSSFGPQESRAAKEDAADALAAALTALHLRELRFVGDLTPALRTAIAAQTELTDLEVIGDGIEELGELAPAPALRRLMLADLRIPTRLTPELLAPLRASPSLRELELRVSEVRGEPGLDEAAVQKALGDQITLRVERSAFTVRK